MSLPIRTSVKVLLLNHDKELLLLCCDDPKTTNPEGEYHGRFWMATGGEIEPNESTQEAAYREIHEEAGIARENVELGPLVWFGEFDLVLAGTLTRLKQSYLVATTSQTATSLANLTPEELPIIKKAAWFSLDDIRNCPDIIYPIVLADHLPDIIAGNYPEPPIEIDLAKQPT